MDNYEVIDMGSDTMSRVKLKSNSAFVDVEYQYGAVKFEVRNDSLCLKFEYEVFSNPHDFDTETVDFRNHIGDILVELMYINNTYNEKLEY